MATVTRDGKRIRVQAVADGLFGATCAERCVWTASAAGLGAEVRVQEMAMAHATEPGHQVILYRELSLLTPERAT